MDSTEQDRAALREMTPERKLDVLSSLIAQAWELKEAWLRARQPDASEEEIRRLARRTVGGTAP